MNHTNVVQNNVDLWA